MYSVTPKISCSRTRPGPRPELGRAMNAGIWPPSGTGIETDICPRLEGQRLLGVRNPAAEGMTFFEVPTGIQHGVHLAPADNALAVEIEPRAEQVNAPAI